ncbi:MAG: Bifunctional methyltransferase [uncultured bacterium (gcode 4)]|uniref:Bifunctional methyltransferase n=1 Tax=uncultured bacterium (gcode 4) TaxID=1234023 RepID=K2FSW1_9BACT|nr:MAG: Bifunctional methyltransferase [uncultured bacterium (gcode 4)]
MKTHKTEEVEFFYNRFYFDKNVLIPRLDTESLVREAIKIAKKENIKTLLDIWTWSWIIPISIDKNVPDLKIYAVEKSKRALKIARANAIKNNSQISFIPWDLLKTFLTEGFDFPEKVLITTNLPYIKNEDWENMSDDTKFEPKMALFWWKRTWFELYEKFFRQVLKLKEKYSRVTFFVICEIWFDQKDIAKKFLKKCNFKFEFFKDLRDIERFIKVII